MARMCQGSGEAANSTLDLMSLRRPWNISRGKCLGCKWSERSRVQERSELHVKDSGLDEAVEALGG